MFIDEALKSYEHPGVNFRPGPTGRRAALAGGPDVWEVITALDDIRNEDPQISEADLLEELGTVTGLTTTQIGIAVRYYAAYPDEIDERIALNRDVADREEKLWEAQQSLLRKRKT
ncbi:hypothetical protein [Actinoplanes italicus]|nr:hypothetical protein [Actinoplanes italicus]